MTACWRLAKVGTWVLALLTAAPAAAQERKDALGDPLPERALVRLGTVRLRHTADVVALAWAPDGKTLAAYADQDSKVVLWNMPDGTPARKLSVTPSYGSGGLAFSPDGHWLAFLGRGPQIAGLLRIWDLTTGKVVVDIDDTRWLFAAVAFAGDKPMLAAGRINGAVETWALDTGKVVTRDLLGKELAGLAFPKADRLVALTQDGKQLRARDLFARQEVFSVPLATDQRVWAAVSPDGHWLAADHGDGTIVLRDAATGKELKRLQGQDSPLLALAFSADDARLVSSNANGSLSVWDVAAGKLVRRWQSRPGCIGALSPDGKTLAVGGHNGTQRIRHFDVASGKELSAHSGHDGGVTGLAFAPDGKSTASVVAGSSDAVVRLWDTATGKLLREVEAQKGGVSAVAFAPDGQQFLTAGHNDSTVNLWDPHTGKACGQFDGGGKSLVNALFTPDGTRILCGEGYSQHTGVGLIDLKTKQFVWQIRHASLTVAALVLSPDGELVARGGHGSYSPQSPDDVRHGLELWAAADGQPIPWDGAEQLRVHRLAFAPDSRLLAIVTDAATLVAEVATQKPVYQWPRAVSVAFAPGGRFAALGLPGGNIAVYDLASGRECLRLACAEALSLVFAPDGKRLASGLADTTVLLWDVADLETVAPLGPTALTRASLETWWAELGSADPQRAYAAGWRFSAAAGHAAPFLRQRLAAMQTPSPEVAGLIADLGNAKFAVRDAAQKKLAKLGRAAEEPLRQALEQKPALEVVQRIEALLTAAEKAGPTERLRTMRAIAVLEQTPGPEAAAALGAVAEGSPSLVVADKARQALKRRNP